MEDAVVVTRYGNVQGKREGAVYSWKGIPYAKPPVGSLRFRAPQPPESWNGIRDAGQFARKAPQIPSELMVLLGEDPNSPYSEDCLYLNIWSPAADDKRRPVMVWIHGGSFLYGSGSADWYDGAAFAEHGDIVLVTINYRLGAFGFLHLGDIGGEEYAASGNCGLLDQVAALQWVKDNIEFFGGDPERVTIFGESAGAMSVGTLLAMPAAQGLFQQAILQSGACSFVKQAQHATWAANKILNVLGVSPDTLSSLEQIPVEQILDAANTVLPMTLTPVVDGRYLPQHPLQALQSGMAKDVSVLIGTNRDEYRLFTYFDPNWKQMGDESMIAACEQIVREEWPAVSAYYVNQQSPDRSLYERLMDALSFKIFGLPALQLAERQVKQGGAVWMYRFDWQSPGYGGGLGAFHALEIPFVFNNLDSPSAAAFIGTSPETTTIADQVHRRWIAFARNGDPNIPDEPHWPPYNLTERAALVFNNESRVEHDPRTEERLVWETAVQQHI